MQNDIFIPFFYITIFLYFHIKNIKIWKHMVGCHSIFLYFHITNVEI